MKDYLGLLYNYFKELIKLGKYQAINLLKIKALTINYYMKKQPLFEFKRFHFRKRSFGIAAFIVLTLLTIQSSFAQQWSAIAQENDVTALASSYTSIAVLDDVPYVIFREGTPAVKVKKRNAVTGVWEQVGNDIGSNLVYARIYADKTNNLYVTYVDAANSNKLAVKTYNSTTNVWEALNGDSNNLYVSSGSVTNSNSKFTTTPRSSLAFDSTNKPYIAFGDNGTMTPFVKKFDGVSWVTVGSGALNAASIAVGVSLVIDEADVPWLVFCNLATTGASTGTMTLYQFTAGAWSAIATPSAIGGIRHTALAINSAGNPVIAFFDATSSTGSNRATVVEYNKTAATWGSLTRLGTKDSTNIILIKDVSGNLYCSFIDAVTSSFLNRGRVFKQLAGATAWTELKDPLLNGIDEPVNDLTIAVGNNPIKPYIVYTKTNLNSAITPVVRFFVTAIYTKAVTNITSTSASTGGDVASDGVSTITERGIVYGSAANPTVADTKIMDASAGLGSFTTSITGLSPATTYNVRAYSINSVGTVLYGANQVFNTLAPSADSVTIIDNGSSVVLNNGIVKATITKSNASVTSLIYNGLELIQGGYNGGSVYWSWNMPNYQNPSGCTYSLVTNPNANNFDSAEIKLHMTWDGTAATAAMDVDVYYSLQRNVSGLYASATLSHPATYPANPGGEWRMASYPNPRFDWLSVDSLRNLVIPSGSASTAVVSGAPPENFLITSGPFTNKYECKYDYSADFGAIDTWGWSSTADNVGLWVTAPSKEYYPGGPMKRELMCHLAPVMLNMLGGTHYGQGDETAVAAGEDWQKTYGPFLIYCNKVPAGTTNASIALWEDAKAKAKTEQAAWPFNWHNDPAYIQESGRGTVTGKLVINDSGNPAASAATMWIGLAIPPTGSGNATNFQAWSKNYQFWVKTDANGNFTIPHVLPGTYSLFAFGSGAIGQLSLSNYVMVTAANTTALGTVNWTPTRVAPTVWEIGTPDRTASEFKHGTDWWTSNTYPNPNWAKFMDYITEFPSDVNFTVGQSNIATDWNYVQPSSNNVPISNPTWNVNFDLATAPVAGSTASVYVALAANFSAALILNVNGTNVTSPTTGMIPGNDTNAMIRKGIHGAFAEVRFNFPASNLHVGANKISFSLRKVGGASSGEVMYDYLRLEASGSTLSVDSFVKSDAVKAYPNPTNNIVTVTIPETAVLEKIMVYNNLGQVVSVEAKNTVSIANLNSGSYYFLIITSTGNYVKKIIKL